MRATRAELSNAFAFWVADYQQHPNEYRDDIKTAKPKTYGDSCADHLTRIINRQRKGSTK